MPGISAGLGGQVNNNIQTDYMNIVKRINYLIDKNDKSIIKMKKINYTGNKVKLENIS